MPRQVCASCGSKRWHKDSSSGQIVCESGHVLTSYIQESHEVEEFSQNGVGHLRKGARKARKSGRDKRKLKKAKLYSGDEAVYVRAEAYQLLLRTQVAIMINEYGFPRELEVVARDLWAVYVSTRKVTPAPLETEPLAAVDFTGTTPAAPAKEPDFWWSDEDEPLDGDDEGDLAEELETLRTSGVSGAMTDGDLTEEEEEAVKAKRARSKPNRKLLDEGAFSTHSPLIILYLSCMTLRLPVLLADLHRMVECGKLPYLQAHRDLPPAMVDHITLKDGHFDIETLTPLAGHNTGSLDAFVRDYVKFFGRFGITFPELNGAPILWRLVRSLGLPPLFYVGVRHLLSLVNADLSLTGGSRSGAGSSSSIVASPRIPPEGVLAAGVIVLAQVIWGLDDRPRVPVDEEDPLAALFDESTWSAVLARLNTLPNVDEPEPLWTTPVQDLDDGQIDDFLDLCDSMLLRPRERQLKTSDPAKFLPLESRRTAVSEPVDLDAELADIYASTPLAAVAEAGTNALAPAASIGKYVVTVREKPEDAKPLPSPLARLIDRLAATIRVPSLDLEALVIRLVTQVEKHVVAEHKAERERIRKGKGKDRRQGPQATVPAGQIRTKELISSSDDEGQDE